MTMRNFHGVEQGPDFDRARSQIATPFQFVDLALDAAVSNQVLNVSGDFLYVDASSTGAVTMELNNQYNDPAAPFLAQSGFALNAIFKQLKLSWSAQPGKKLRLMYSTGERVIPANSGLQSVNILGTPAVTVGNEVAVTERGIAYTGSYKSNSNLSANTPDVIIAPGANVNGAILLSAGFFSRTNSQIGATILAKASAPASIIDGDVLVGVENYVDASSVSVMGSLKQRVRIPAGKGVYYIANVAETTALRHALFVLL